MKTPSWYDVAAAVGGAPLLEEDFSNVNDVRANHTFAAKDAVELQAVLGAIAYNLNSFGVSSDITRNIDTVVEHESQHAYASSRLGAKERGFEVNIFHNSEGKLEFIATHRFGQGLSRLATAAIALYPAELSKFDVHDAHLLGYDVPRIAKEAERARSETGTYIPVPLSYTPKDAKIIDLAARSARRVR